MAHWSPPGLPESRCSSSVILPWPSRWLTGVRQACRRRTPVARLTPSSVGQLMASGAVRDIREARAVVRWESYDGQRASRGHPGNPPECLSNVPVDFPMNSKGNRRDPWQNLALSPRYSLGTPIPRHEIARGLAYSTPRTAESENRKARPREDVAPKRSADTATRKPR